MISDELGSRQEQLQEWRRAAIWNRLKWQQAEGEQPLRAIWGRHYLNLPDSKRWARRPLGGEWREKSPHAPEHDPEQRCWSCCQVSLKGHIHQENRLLAELEERIEDRAGGRPDPAYQQAITPNRPDGPPPGTAAPPAPGAKE